ncbi:unnamed protein product [Meganyctiphanes norvegica]|uniref:Solute carrier organic anion transporter family member n=1 Tax=Meganyctiphanes norvegica TaxID=48144 RepID=A0AAV2PKD4_MEGNR
MENGSFAPDESITTHQNGVGRLEGNDGKIENGGKKEGVKIENGGRDATSVDEELKEKKVGILCGAAGIYPTWIQGLARPRVFLLVYCLQQVTLGACNSFFVGANTSIEKHFNYKSSDIGLIMLLSEIGPFLFTMLLSYWGGQGNRPRWMGIGPIISSFGIFMCYLIYLIFPAPALSESGSIDDKSKKFCRPKEEISFSPLEPGSSNSSITYSITGEEEEFTDICFEPNGGAGFMWVVAHTLIGMGTAVTYTVGASYLDDNISKNDAPIYFGVTLAVRILGPLIGFVTAGRLLRIYVNPSQSYGITPKDPRWIGAWWIGPLIFSVLMFLMSFLLLLFPEKMIRGSGSRSSSNNNSDRMSILFSKNSVNPASKTEIDNQSQDEGVNKNKVLNTMNGNGTNQVTKHQNGHIKEDQFKTKEDKIDHFGLKSLKQDLQGLLQMLKKLVKNKPLMYLIISDFCAFLGILGLIFWLPKYLEHQFRVSKSKSAQYAGISSTVSIIFGVVGGCVWIRRCHPSAKTVSFVMGTCSFIYAISLIGLMFVTCDFNDDQPGILSPDKSSLELYRGCSSSACDCGKAEFIPVCVEDGSIKLTYFSPCHAGCPVIPDQPSNATEFFNCTCGSPNAKVTTGYCRDTCSGFIFYNIYTMIVKSFVSIGAIGGLLITMRCVTPEEKPVALGIKTTLISLVVMVNPLVFAKLTDSSCLVWSEACGENGSCWIYNADDLGYKLHGCAAVLFIISGIFEFLLAFNVGDLKLMDEPKKSLGATPSTTTTGRFGINSLRNFSQRTLTSSVSVNTTSSSANNSIRSVNTKEELKIEETIPESDDVFSEDNGEVISENSVNESNINDKTVLPSDIVKQTGV